MYFRLPENAECRTEVEQEVCQVVSNKQSQAGTRGECHTEYSTTTKTVQNKQWGKVDMKVCSRVP